MKKIAVLSLLLIFLSSFAFAGTVDLPKTGQTKCYDSSGAEISCAGTGQDGEIQAGVAWPYPRFTKNADTSITDNLTGLIWASNGNIMPTRDPGWDADWVSGEYEQNDGRVTWQHALDYVEKLNAENYLGHIDWRLPNVNELESLINANEDDIAAWLNTQGFTNVQAGYYWSSTSHGSADAWYVDMWMGVVDYYSKSRYEEYYEYVWPVRGGQCGSFVDSVICLPKTGQTKCYNESGTETPCSGTGQDGDIQAGVPWPTPRFTDNGDETITDNLTGLMWTINANLPSSERTWKEALDYILFMNAGIYPNYGYTDWRLPNRNELHSLTDFSRSYPALPAGHLFYNVQAGGWYWSSTAYAVSPDEGWALYMSYGYVWNYGKSASDCYVWPVRAGQIGPLDHWVISGRVTGDVQVGVTMNLSGTGSGSTTTDSSGTYSFTGLSNGTYTVTPSKTGYTFSPSSIQVTISGANQTGKNFIATAVSCATWDEVIQKYQDYVNCQAP